MKQIYVIRRVFRVRPVNTKISFSFIFVQNLKKSNTLGMRQGPKKQIISEKGQPAYHIIHYLDPKKPFVCCLHENKASFYLT